MPGGRNKPRYRTAGRDLVAFQYLMAEEAEDGDGGRAAPGAPPTRPGKQKGKGKGKRGGNAFQLREEADRKLAPGAGMVPALVDMFPQHGQRAVEEACARFPGSMEQAVEALLRLDLSGSGTSSTAAVAQASAGPSAHGHGDAPEAHAAGPDLWDALPRECKQLVLQRLSVKDVARAARTCAELAAHARATMDARKFVDVPAGLSTAQITGMCRAHRHLTDVSLYACREQFKHEWDYQRLFEAVAAGTQVGASSQRCPLRHWL
eukprot:jgi/Tetstr1/464571/TSEL_009327.t1